jgi:hypothetical protein
MKRRALMLLMIVSAFSLPVSCVPIITVLNMVNPMQSAFVTSFTVANHLDTEICITPIGACGPQGRRATLPQYRSRWPAVRAADETDLRIAPGRVRTVLYDWDDINFSEILVRTDEWRKVLVVDPEPTQHRYHSPRVTHFAINASTMLAEPTAQVLEAARVSGEGRMWFLMGVGVVGPMLFFFAAGRYRRL